MPKLISHDLIRTEIRRLVSQLPPKEQHTWLPRQYHPHLNLRKDLQDILAANPKHSFTARQLADLLTAGRNENISTGSVTYHLNKLIASQDVTRVTTNVNRCWWAYQTRTILHLTCTDPADAEVHRNYTDGTTAYRLRLDIFGQQQWVYADPFNKTWKLLTEVKFKFVIT